MTLTLDENQLHLPAWLSIIQCNCSHSTKINPHFSPDGQALTWSLESTKHFTQSGIHTGIPLLREILCDKSVWNGFGPQGDPEGVKYRDVFHQSKSPRDHLAPWWEMRVKYLMNVPIIYRDTVCLWVIFANDKPGLIIASKPAPIAWAATFMPNMFFRDSHT